MEKCFEIATDDGSLFCKCQNENGTPVLIGKNGSLCLQKLIDQAYQPELAAKMRGRKIRTKQKS